MKEERTDIGYCVNCGEWPVEVYQSMLCKRCHEYLKKRTELIEELSKRTKKTFYAWRKK